MRNDLLYMIQNEFPLHERPFGILADRLNTTEEKVVDEISMLKEEGIIRQTSAIFDTKRLGYRSSLVAFKITGNDSDIEKAAEIINTHPGVSHNYLRNHEYNLWFTIAVAPDSKMGLEATVERLSNLTSATDSIILPTKKMFKISVKLDTAGKRSKKEKVHRTNYENIKLGPREYAAIRELQKDIPATKEPFKGHITRLNISYDELFDIANRLKKAGIMRRFASILNHRNAGFTANAMSVWVVPEETAEETGRQIAQFSAVSHCYLRPVFPSWPYNLFAMVHAKTQDECDRIIEEISEETGIQNYAKLYSTREFKKQRIKYFDPSFEDWENCHIKI